MSESVHPSAPPPANISSAANQDLAAAVAPLAAAPTPGTASARSVDSMAFVMDVPVELTVELGRKRVKIADVLRLGPGSVLELDKPNGEPLDIYVNDRLVARAEAVVVGERYGVRVTEVLVHEDQRHGGDHS